MKGKIKNKMKNIKDYFIHATSEYGKHCDISECDNCLEIKTESIIFMIVAPHSGTDNRWMLRISTISAFDRWANSTAIEEFFSLDIELCDYLSKYRFRIYKTLLKYLSEEYDELEGNR